MRSRPVPANSTGAATRPPLFPGSKPPAGALPGPGNCAGPGPPPATVSWVEAADGGDPRKDVPIRDTIFLLDAPFDASPRKLAELPLRFSSLMWGNGHLALIQEERWKDRKRIILAVAPDTPAAPV